MSNFEFSSLIGSFIDAFISQKQASGYPYKSSARILHHFDLHVAAKFPEETTIPPPDVKT